MSHVSGPSPVRGHGMSEVIPVVHGPKPVDGPGLVAGPSGRASEASGCGPTGDNPLTCRGGRKGDAAGKLPGLRGPPGLVRFVFSPRGRLTLRICQLLLEPPPFP